MEVILTAVASAAGVAVLVLPLLCFTWMKANLFGMK